MTDQADMEARAREVLARHTTSPGNPRVIEAIEAMLAYAAEREAAAYDRAAEVARNVGKAQMSGWAEHPSDKGCGGSVAANNTGEFAALAILSLKEGKG